MRIVQFVTNLDIGGTERLAVDLAECQLADGHQPFIYCLTHGGRLADEAAAKGVCVRTFGKADGPHPSIVWKISQQLRRDRPDVLHTHNHLVHHYGVAAAALARIPVVVNTRHRAEFRFVNTPQGSRISPEAKDRKSDLIFRATLPWVDGVVMISEATRRFFVEYRSIPEAKTRVILNGSRLEKFLSARANPGSALPRIRFGVAARLVPEKDHFTLLRAFKAVCAAIPEAELQIAGDGYSRRQVEDFASELKLTQQVKFLGAVGNMPQFFSQLDIFVLSSLNEGMPLSVLEAMAVGLPIVSTRAGGVAEAAVGGQNAYFAEVGDAGGLAEAMIRMARSPDLARMGALGPQIVQERFRIEETWRNYYELFRSLGARN